MLMSGVGRFWDYQSRQEVILNFKKHSKDWRRNRLWVVETIKGCKHPAIYPLYIIKELIRLLSRPGEIILDPFIGSGTIAVAAKELRYVYIGIDINEEYCKYAKLRLENSGINKPQELFIRILFIKENPIQKILRKIYQKALNLLNESKLEALIDSLDITERNHIQIIGGQLLKR